MVTRSHQETVGMSNKETFEKWIDMQSPRYDTLKLHDGSYRNPVTALLWRTWNQAQAELFKVTAGVAMSATHRSWYYRSSDSSYHSCGYLFTFVYFYAIIYVWYEDLIIFSPWGVTIIHEGLKPSKFLLPPSRNKMNKTVLKGGGMSVNTDKNSRLPPSFYLTWRGLLWVNTNIWIF